MSSATEGDVSRESQHAPTQAEKYIDMMMSETNHSESEDQTTKNNNDNNNNNSLEGVVIAMDNKEQINNSNQIMNKTNVENDNKTNNGENKRILKKNQTPQQRFLEKLEMKSILLCERFSHLTGTLRSTTHAINAMTLSHLELYRNSVMGVCNTVKDNTGDMARFIERCEDMNQNLNEMKKLHVQIKEVKKMIIILDSLLNQSQ